MQTPTDKLDLDSISLDNMLGDGLDSLPSIEDTAVEEESQEDLAKDLPDIEEEEQEQEQEEQEEQGEETEEREEDEEIETDAGTVASEIAKTLGFELENEYADTVEGLTEFAKDLAQEVAEDQLGELFEQYPEVQKHLDYLMSGGDSNKFYEAYNPNSDYSNFTINEKDTNTQRAVLEQYFQIKGHDESFIQEMLDDYEDSGKLYSKADQAKGALAEAQTLQRERMLETQKEQQNQTAEETSQFWDNVAETIETGNEFAGVKIPDRQKSKFFEYISEPVGKRGETQRDIDYADAEIDVKLAIDYLMYNGFKLDNIIDTKAKTKSAQNLRTRIQSNQEKTKSAKRASRRTKDFDPDNLDMTALF